MERRWFWITNLISTISRFNVPILAEEICLTEECIQTGRINEFSTEILMWLIIFNVKTLKAASLLAGMDSSANPCEDFFQYACGTWNKKHVIPEDRSSISTFEVSWLIFRDFKMNKITISSLRFCQISNKSYWRVCSKSQSTLTITITKRQLRRRDSTKAALTFVSLKNRRWNWIRSDFCLQNI